MAQIDPDEEPENELGIENATEVGSGILVGTRVRKSFDFDESLAMVGVSGGYAIEDNFDVLVSLDYEALHLPMSTRQQDRLFLAITSRRTFDLDGAYRWRVGAVYVHGADLNAETALDYASGEANVVLLRDFRLVGTAKLDVGIGLFARATQHAMPGAEGLMTMHEGIYAGIYVPFEFSIRVMGHHFTWDTGVKLGYDQVLGGIKVGGAGRGPLHDFSR